MPKKWSPWKWDTQTASSPMGLGEHRQKAWAAVKPQSRRTCPPEAGGGGAHQDGSVPERFVKGLAHAHKGYTQIGFRDPSDRSVCSGKVLSHGFAHGLGKNSEHDGLHDKPIDPECPCLVFAHALAEPRAENDRDAGSGAHQFAGEGVSGHIGHGQVHDHQIEAVGAGPEGFKRLQGTGIFPL